MTGDDKQKRKMEKNIADITEISDSSEVMMARVPHSITIFVLIVLAIFIAAFVWAYFGRMDTYVRAAGEIRPSDTVSTLSVASGGRIAEIYYANGEIVTKGEMIIKLDGSYYAEQIEKAEKQISDRKEDIENYKLLSESIKSDSNMFSEEENPTFYYQYLSYEIELEGAMAQIDKSNSQINSSLGEINEGINQAYSASETASAQYSSYIELYDAVYYDEEYSGSDSAMKNLYDSYSGSRIKAWVVYDAAVSAYEKLKEQQKGGTATEEQVEAARKTTESAKADYDLVKSSMLVNLDEAMQTLLGNISTYQSNIGAYAARKEGLIYDNTAELSRDKIKNTYYTNINSKVENLEKEIESLESTVRDAEEMLSKLTVAAGTTGTVVFAKEYSAGDTISAGETIATVVPDTDSYRVTLYIAEKYIAEIEPGQKVEYVFSAISRTDYGKVYGEIVDISADSLADSSGNKYFKADATIDSTVLYGNDGDTRQLKTGMIAEAHTITGTQRIISWLLDKLNFR